MRKALSLFVFALGLAVGIAGPAIGENRLVPAMGISQGDADGLYGSLAGESGWSGTQDFSLAVLLAADAKAAGSVVTLGFGDARYLLASGGAVTGPIYLPVGTNIEPSYSWSSASSTGIFLSKTTPPRMAISIAGVNIITFDGVTSITWDGNAVFGNAVGDSVIFNAGTVTHAKATTVNIDAAITYDATGFSPLFKGTTYDYTQCTNVTVPDANAATEAINQQVGDARYILASGDTVTGNLQVDGHTILGDADADNVTVNAATVIFNTEMEINFEGATNVIDSVGVGVFWEGDRVDLTDVADFAIPDADAADEAINQKVGDERYILLTGSVGIAGTHDFTGATLEAKAATADTHVVNRLFGDGRYQSLSSVKSGTVAGGSFAGNPKVFTVTFGTAFPDTNYAVSVVGEESRTYTFQTKLAGSFVINTNANLAIVGDVDWTATAHNDP